LRWSPISRNIDHTLCKKQKYEMNLSQRKGERRGKGKKRTEGRGQRTERKREKKHYIAS
jgi:hypothetical protein